MIVHNAAEISKTPIKVNLFHHHLLWRHQLVFLSFHIKLLAKLVVLLLKFCVKLLLEFRSFFLYCIHISIVFVIQHTWCQIDESLLDLFYDGLAIIMELFLVEKLISILSRASIVCLQELIFQLHLFVWLCLISYFANIMILRFGILLTSILLIFILLGYLNQIAQL